MYLTGHSTQAARIGPKDPRMASALQSIRLIHALKLLAHLSVILLASLAHKRIFNHVALLWTTVVVASFAIVFGT